ncbi:methyl-accepting chemotaxis protein [Pseudomonas sp. R2.Fl]|nr:methyl-accepting chemotaxis protein [Pseudomonas sp. R2.Fl]
MRLSNKLPLAAALFALVSIGASTVASLYLEYGQLKQQVFEKLEATADGRRNEARGYLDGIRLDVASLSSSFTTQQALFGFSGGLNFLGEDPAKELQTRYIDENPNPDGEKYKLDTAKKDAYDRAHKQYHAGFVKHLQAQGYYDIFLINPAGVVVYTAMKERDFGTSLVNGPYKDSGLAKVFQAAIQSKDGSVSMSEFEAYEPSGGDAASFVAAPILQNGRPIGVLAYQLANSRFNALYANSKGLGETGETILVSTRGDVINDSVHTPENDSLAVKVDAPLVTAALSGQEATGELPGYRDMTSYAASSPLDFAGSRWAVVALVDSREVAAKLWTSALMSIVIGAALILVSAVVALFYARRLTTPISRLVDGMAELARGKTDINLEGQDRSDEIGDMVRSVAVFRQAAIDKQMLERESEERRNATDADRRAREAEKAAEQAQLSEAIEVLGAALQRLANGDLTARIERPFSSNLDRLRVDFNASLDRLSQTVASVRSNVTEINGKSRKVGSLTDDLSQRTEQQAAALVETSAAIRQIMEAIRHSSERAEIASKLATDARGNSDRSGSIVADAVSAMERIENASTEISKIINVIDEIAFQTNLLALNAGVEAARAGEAGKGFAVVAQEVRELAQRSANAAKDIKALITKSGAEVASGVDLVKETGSVLSTIAGQVVEINDHIHSIAGAARQQSAGLKEISGAVERMEDSTQKNAQAAMQTNGDMRQLSQDAEGLAGLIGQFTVDDSAPAAFVPPAPRADSTAAVRASAPTALKARAPAPRVAPATEKARPVASPARSLLTKLSTGLGSKLASNDKPGTDADWEEF